MNTALWIMTGLLGLAYTVGGSLLIMLSKEKYRSFGVSQHWVDDFSALHLKAIGAVKLLGALGLVLPAVLGTFTVLSPVAACGLALFMSGAVTTRLRRSEWTYLVGDLFYLGLFVFLAWGRFDLQPL